MFLREKSDADFPVFLHLVFQTSHRATIQQSYISRQKQIKKLLDSESFGLGKGKPAQCGLLIDTQKQYARRFPLKYKTYQIQLTSP